MKCVKAENNVIPFSSFTERAEPKTCPDRLRIKARLALAQGQKEAFLEDLSGYVDEVLDNRASLIRQESPGVPPVTQRQPALRFRLLQGGKQ